MKEAIAISPGHVTGFFQICDQPPDPLSQGSRGAGVSITRGVTTKVQVKESASASVKIAINGAFANSAEVSKYVADTFLILAERNYEVLIDHHVTVPVGCGFGTSGAGALSLALALNEAFNLSLSNLEAAQIAHRAEIDCKTGLGTVIAETRGGLGIRVKPGAPGVGQIKSVLLKEDYVVACLSFGSISTRKILTSRTSRQRINGLGGDLVDDLVSHPTMSSFMELSRRFADHVGLISERLRKVLVETDGVGLPCSMAMLGETAFSVVRRDQAEEIQNIFSKYVSSEGSVIMTEMNCQGARLL